MKQKGYIQVLILTFIILGLLVGVFLVKQTTDIAPDAKGPTKAVPVQQAIENIEGRVPPIENKTDLLNRLNDLNNEDIATLEQDIAVNESETSQF